MQGVLTEPSGPPPGSAMASQQWLLLTLPASAADGPSSQLSWVWRCSLSALPHLALQGTSLTVTPICSPAGSPLCQLGLQSGPVSYTGVSDLPGVCPSMPNFVTHCTQVGHPMLGQGLQGVFFPESHTGSRTKDLLSVSLQPTHMTALP